ncbi:SpoIIE family protein phosphatase [Tundrisphaera sp. TA3]|uniref:SpoIIE family protein phosphatase n=1 Tax=Tundrisphaera sp. TA3 TaxID=3435775 RepID=UPI003EBA53B3
MRETLALAVEEPSQAGEARRAATSMAARAGFDPTGQGKVALLVTEIANNLVRHASQGELILRVLSEGDDAGLEILSLDKGPGMADVRRCLADGFSTGTTPGVGLGAVVRMSDEFDIHSAPGQGTVMMSRCWTGPRDRTAGGLEVGAVCRPIAGEVISGDSWMARESDPVRSLVMVADGLGHGPLAADASLAAIKIFARTRSSAPAEILREAHEALRGTRGAAVAVAAVDRGRREVAYAGVGNIFGMILAPSGRSGLVSHNGTLGADARKFQEFTYAWPEGAMLVMHSDGLTTQWRLDRSSALGSRDPSVVAGVLYRDHTRGRDDATVVVARDGDGGQP